MKSGIIYLVGLLGATMAQAAGTWTVLNSGTTRALRDVQCPVGACYVAGDSGIVLQSRDVGASWALRAVPGTPGEVSIAFADSLHGYYAGGRSLGLGTLKLSYKTNNGGITWDSIETGHSWRRVHLVGRDQGYFTSDRSELVGYTSPPNRRQIYATRGVMGRISEGMETKAFYVSSSGNSANSCALYFTGGPTGFAACSAGHIARTVNWANTWSEQTISSAALNGLHFPRSRIGYVVGDSGRIFRTQDSGVTWSVQVSGTRRHLRGVRFADGEAGYAVGDSGTILATSNGGLTWTFMASGTSARLHAVALAGDGSTGFAVGEGGVLLKLKGGTPGVPSSLSVPVLYGKARRSGIRLELPDGRVFNLLGRQGR